VRIGEAIARVAVRERDAAVDERERELLATRADRALSRTHEATGEVALRRRARPTARAGWCKLAA